jgi:hypothetical protein
VQSPSGTSVAELRQLGRHPRKDEIIRQSAEFRQLLNERVDASSPTFQIVPDQA